MMENALKLDLLLSTRGLYYASSYWQPLLPIHVLFHKHGFLSHVDYGYGGVYDAINVFLKQSAGPSIRYEQVLKELRTCLM